MQARKVVSLIRQACEEKQGGDTVVLDLKKLPAIASYFVISSGNSDRHVRAIAENIVSKLAQSRQDSRHVEGKEDARWILLDYGDVIAHIFYQETRRFYNLERLWGNARRLT